MKKTYTKKQITEAIAYWTKQLHKINESRNDDLGKCPHCHKTVNAIILYDNEDNGFDSNGPAMVLYADKSNKAQVVDALKKMQSTYDICDSDKFDDLVSDVMSGSFIMCSDYGDSDWQIYVA